jgi:phage gpG-like protein
MLRFEAEISGEEFFDRSFNRITEFIDDFRSVWPFVIEWFYSTEHEQLDSEGAKGAHGIWKRLTSKYFAWKEKHYPGKPIMQLTGKLYASLTDFESPDAVLRMEKTELTIGTQTEYARFHQLGGDKLPRRSLIAPSGVQKRGLQKAIQRPLVEFARRQGFQVTE